MGDDAEIADTIELHVGRVGAKGQGQPFNISPPAPIPYVGPADGTAAA
jgi:hypothetical protein